VVPPPPMMSIVSCAWAPGTPTANARTNTLKSARRRQRRRLMASDRFRARCPASLRSHDIVEAERHAEALAGAPRLVACRIRSDNDAKHPVGFVHLRFDAQPRDLVREAPHEGLRIGVVGERAELH